MKHGFIKVAAVSPKVQLAACNDNISEMLALTRKAEDLGARIVVFPELCVTGASCGDLFYFDTLLESAKNAVCRFVESTKNSDTIIIIGFPLVVNDKLYNCAAICQGGDILGIVPKSTLTRDDARYFSAPVSDLIATDIGDHTVSFGPSQIFQCASMPSLRIGIEIGDEAFAPISSADIRTTAGATLIANPFAVPETVCGDEMRELLLCAHTRKEHCAYVQAGAGEGESTTDGVYGGQSLILENGAVLAKTNALDFDADRICITDIDLGIISHERRKASVASLDEPADCTFDLEFTETELTRKISPSPFIPDDTDECAKRCEKILNIQARGLAQRITKAYAKTAVIGISGGLDSCLAVLVAARACDMLGRPRTDILGVTMPCFGTTKRTRSNAELLCSALGARLVTVNIGDAVKQHFSDIGHDENDHSVVYENSQARERTQVIMDLANKENGFVVGTGDLSELALGWATYNGDHMSMYGVNGGVPKTLIRHIVGYCADVADARGEKDLSDVLRDILDTPVSPELLPADENGNIAQKTEDLVGPYEIHDFYIYYTLRYGFSPDKLYRMAKIALGDKYSDEELKKWLINFAKRFFSQQFKRSCLPDGPKVGSVCVSPRGALMMPSDASSAEWLRIIETL